MSSLAWHLLVHDSPYTVAGFVEDHAFRGNRDSFHGLPLVDYERVSDLFPPASHALLLPIGWRDGNRFREERFAHARAMGYRLARYASSRAVIPPDFVIEANVLIHDAAVIQPFTEVGENVQVRAGAIISHHVRIGPHSYIAPGACIGGEAVIGVRCVLGLGCVILSRVEIADDCFVGAGAVVVKSLEEPGTYIGVPAKRMK